MNSFKIIFQSDHVRQKHENWRKELRKKNYFEMIRFCSFVSYENEYSVILQICVMDKENRKLPPKPFSKTAINHHRIVQMETSFLESLVIRFTECLNGDFLNFQGKCHP